MTSQVITSQVARLAGLVLVLGVTVVACTAPVTSPATPVPPAPPTIAAPPAAVAPVSAPPTVAAPAPLPAQPSAPQVGAPSSRAPAGVATSAPANSSAIAPAPLIASAAPASAAQGFGGGAAIQPQVILPIATPGAVPVRGIIVTGSGQVDAPPDRAFVTAGVQTRGRTAQEAQNENNLTMQAVIAAIKAVGIPDKSIQTIGVSLYPTTDQGQVITGYDASNEVDVTIDQISQAGAVLDAAVKAGANQSAGVRFGLKDQTTARNQALAAAATDARSKATALATALGLQITGVESVSEQNVNVPTFSPPRAFAGAPAAQSVPIEPGQLTVSAQVTIVFGY
jgi:uncharacterized protein YggE